MRLPVAPTKSNLLVLKNRLHVAQNGYDLLEQKREILVMELMRMVEKTRLLEQAIKKQINNAYPSLRRMLVAVGRNKAEQAARMVDYKFRVHASESAIAGMRFAALSVDLPEHKLVYSFMDSYADCDKVMHDFFELLKLLTEMASIRTVVWRLAAEVKKTQRRVNALDTEVIPRTAETCEYIENVLEEHEREGTFVLKILKSKRGGNI